MADGLLGVDLDELLKKVVAQYNQKSEGSPLNQGLLAAGAQMLMNSNKGLAPALGAGGMGFLEASNAERQRQTKDPMQLLQMVGAVQNMKQQQAADQWMRQFGGSPQPQAPQYGMQDRSAGAMPAPQPQGQPALGDLIRGIGLPGGAGEIAKVLYKTATESPTKAGPGDTLFSRNPYTGQLEQGQQIPNLDKGMQMGPGGVQPMPGYAQSAADIAGATAAAQERAKAGQDVITVKEAGRERPVVRSQFIAEQQGGPPANVASDIAKALANWEAEGRPGGQFQYTYRPPNKANPTKAEEAAQVQAATLPGELNKSLAEGLGKYSVEALSVGHKAAEEAAYNEIPAIQEVRQRIANGAFAGGGAETKTAILNQINGWFGTTIASPQIAQSQALNSALGKQLLANAKKLGANPTEADAKRIDNIVGKQGLSPDALLEIADVQEKMAKQAIDRHNKRLDSMEAAYKDRGLPTDVLAGLRVKAPEVEVKKSAPGNAKLQDVVNEMRKRGLIQ